MAMRTLLLLAACLGLAAAPQQGKGKYPAQGEGIAEGKDAVLPTLKKLKLKADDKDETVDLSALKGAKPLLLIFGSYT